jgi:hypothetical protein
MGAAIGAVEILAQAGGGQVALDRAMQELHSAVPRTETNGDFGPAG